MAVLKPLDIEGTPREWGLKLLEEASEACEALKGIEEADGVPLGRHRALMEVCDVLQAVCGCLHELEVTPAELDKAVLDMRFGNCGRWGDEVRDAPSLVFGLFGRCAFEDECGDDEDDVTDEGA